MCDHPGMQYLRSRHVRLLVLAWFAFFAAATAAAPIVHPTTLEAVCSATHGGKLLQVDLEGNPAGGGALDTHCPLCSLIDHRPGACGGRFDPPSALAHALVPAQAAHLAAVTAPPLPARGPPSLMR